MGDRASMSNKKERLFLLFTKMFGYLLFPVDSRGYLQAHANPYM
jgi:hypothetical protein